MPRKKVVAVKWDGMNKDSARQLRDAIRIYGARQKCTEQEYDTLYEFGLWYADHVGASDVVLSDWTPGEVKTT